ncbi:MAG TPA: DUF5916 domain-containing protein [Gemmatimonadales bacterium]|nr:DUF5916 domain-containing protein [Gemmatimonadales bacterium]
MLLAHAFFLLQTVGGSAARSAGSAHPGLADSAILMRHAGSGVPPVIVAVRVSHPPALDGRLDDPAWAAAAPVGGFREGDPHEGALAPESTSVRIVYDDEALYIGARLYDAEPAKITRRLARRDDDPQGDDILWVDLDSYHDHRTAYEFGVNPAGTVRDDFCSNDSGFCDFSWDAVWQVKTGIDSLGWVVEMRIPFSQLRFPPGRVQVWGVNFFRNVARRNAWSMWAFRPKVETGYASRFGHLVGLRDIPAPRRLELVPYSLGQAGYDSPAPANPFDRGHAYSGTLGLDLKYGVTSNLTLGAAVNPDFGQVESDPAFVNLTAFEQFLPERRPLFVEGANVFSFGGTGPFISFGYGPRYFYSRRIGRGPTLAPDAPSGGFLDQPSTTSILGAAKLTGRTPGGWWVGVLDAVTGREQARLADASGRVWRQDVQPLTNAFVARLAHQTDGRTEVGLFLTAADRRIGSAALDSLRSAGYVGGAEFFHRWANNAYSAFGSIGISYVRGDTLAMRLTEEQSNHYYQRPDASYLQYDPRRTSLTGASADVALSKEAGRFNWSVALSSSTPGFEVNDLGFQVRADRVTEDWLLQYRWTQPGRVFRSASIATDPDWRGYNFGGDLFYHTSDVILAGQLLNWWSGRLALVRQWQTIDDRLTRGGPRALGPAGEVVNLSLASDVRPRLSGTLGVNYYRDVSASWSLAVSPLLSFRPSSAILFSLGPSYTVGWSAAQYVVTHTDSTATATAGHRYVFGELAQRQLNTTFRLNVTLSPLLSVQLYAQPFTFSGRYRNFKELAAPRTFDFRVYGRDPASSISQAGGVYTVHPTGSASDTLRFPNPDFRIRSWRSNAVLRWEYRPGSALFLVWTQSRLVTLADPSLDLAHYLGREVFLDPPTNVFIVKLSYWLSR